MFSEIFEITTLHRDYENAWEWLEGVSREGFHVNISRTHDWQTGDHHLPVVISLRWRGRRLAYAEALEWMQKLANRLGVDVSAGVIVEGQPGTEYGFRVDEIIRKQEKG